MSRFSELKNRNVFRVAAAYIVAAWLVIQVVETIFPAFGFGDPAVRVVVIVLAIGLVPAVVFSWLYEVTPEGIRREGTVDHGAPSAVRAVRKLDRAIIVILTLAVGFFAFDKFVLDPVRDSAIEKSTAERVRSEALAESYGGQSIAVMPFVNMSDDAANEYFSDGMAEELLNLLARTPRLRVISQSSSFSLKGKGLTIPEVAERLNAALVLEGSVRKSGDRVRITAQLIEARSDTHLWSETYDRTLDDLFAVQDEISAAIVTELREKLRLDIGTAPAATATASAQAHDAYLRGRYLMGQRKPGTKSRAAAEFGNAIVLDPAFAPAYAERAIALSLGGCGDLGDDACLAQARADSERAMALDPGLAEAHVAAAWVSAGPDNQEQTGSHFRRALEINPNYALVYIWMAGWGLFESQEEAYAAAETAMRLDPLSPVTNFGYFQGLLERGQLDDANAQIEKYAAIDPKGATILRGRLAALDGAWSNYVLAYLEAASSGTDDLTFAWAAFEDAQYYLAAMGLEDEARRLGDDLSLDLMGFGEPEARLARLRIVFAENPDSMEVEGALNMALSHAGKYAEVRPLLEADWKWFHRVSLAWGWSWVLNESAQALVAILLDAGDEAGAAQVLGEYRDYLARFREAGIVQTQWNTSIDWFEGVVAYLSGERDSGLALMARAAADGYWVRPPAPYQQAMHDDPGFAPILEAQQARQAREQGRLLAVVCRDNPYTAVWHPAPATCARYYSATD